MKKVLLTVLCGMFALMGFSQARLDVRAGMSMANLTNMDSDMKIGYTLGLGVDYTFTDMWALQTGLMFSSKGAKDGDAKIKSHYMEIPILAAAKFTMSDRARFVINAGPYMAIGLGGEAEVEGGGLDVSTKLFTDNGADWKRFDLGLQYGVGFEMNDHYLINLTGQYGFIAPKEYVGDNPKNLAFYITLGYRF